MMRYGSVCSGIEAATVAWHPLGWRASFVSEIEAFPRAVLQTRWPEIPLHGDFTTIEAGDYEPIDLLVGGTPCQSFSVAGLRGGLDDERGNLALEYLRLARRLRPRWLVWENVPGVLSSNGGRDFGAILGGMVELRYGFAYRVLDAQYFGVPQRRRRVFVVGYLGDWRPAAAVLFEREGLCGHPPPRREARQVAAPILSSRPSGGGGRLDFETETFVVGTLSANGKAAGSATTQDAFAGHLGGDGQTVAALKTGGGKPGQSYPAIAFHARQDPDTGDVTHPIDPDGHSIGVKVNSGVRRLTPRECERLQGFPDDYTLIEVRGKPAADGPRYKALGNSMAVPVMAWIGRRIDAVEALVTERKAA